MEQDIIRVLRIIEYVGPRNKVEDTVKRSIHGEKVIEELTIKAATLGTVSEILGTTEYKPKEKFLLVTALSRKDANCMERRLITVASIREFREIDGTTFILRNSESALKVAESIDEIYAQMRGDIKHGTN